MRPSTHSVAFFSNVPDVVRMDQDGIELKMVANFVSRGRGYLIVRPEIKKPSDLAGKRIGVQSIGGTLWMYVMLTLEQLGLDTTRDRIHLLVIGDQTVIAPSLESQVIDAAVLTTRTYIPGLKQKGFSVFTEVTPAMGRDGNRRSKDRSAEKSRDHRKHHEGVDRK